MLPPLSHAHSRSIIPRGLRPGDVIVSTTHGKISRLIRRVTNSPVSHSLVYLGNGRVIEAVTDGVVERSLATALADATLAVVYRHNDMDTGAALTVLSEALSHIGAGYDYLGAAVSPSPAWCGTLGSDERFFCSELLVDAFNESALALTGKSPACSTPEDIVQTFTAGNTDYVGHLVTDGSIEHDLTTSPTEDTTVVEPTKTHENSLNETLPPVPETPPATDAVVASDNHHDAAGCPLPGPGVADGGCTQTPPDSAVPHIDPYNPGGSHGGP